MNIQAIANRQGFFVNTQIIGLSELIINKPIVYSVRDGKVEVSLAFSPSPKRHAHTLLDSKIEQGLFTVFDGSLLQVEMTDEVLAYLNTHYAYRPLQDLQSEVTIQEAHAATFFVPGKNGSFSQFALYTAPKVLAGTDADADQPDLPVDSILFAVPLALAAWVSTPLFDQGTLHVPAVQLALHAKIHCPSRIGTLVNVLSWSDLYTDTQVDETQLQIRVGRYILTLCTYTGIGYYILSEVSLAW